MRISKSETNSQYKPQMLEAHHSGPDERPIAVFDLDGTLTKRSTFLPFLIGFCRRSRRVGGLLRMPFVVAAYVLRLRRDHETKERLLIDALGGATVSDIEDEAARLCDEWIPDNLHPLGMELLTKHQQAGHRVILLSASPDVYVLAVARAFGIEETICTRVAIENGVCIGTLLGENCKGPRKLAALKEYLATQQPPDDSCAYGDSRHDLPVLEWVHSGWLVGRHSAMQIGIGDSEPVIVSS